MVRIQRMASVAVLTIAAISPAIVAAQELSDQWKFRASIYGWLPDIGGSTTFPAGTGTSINVNADKIIDTLKFTFMGTFEAQKGRWGAFTDVIYLDVGGSKSQTRDLTVGNVTLPAGVTADAQLDIKAWVWTLAGTYRVVSDPGFTMDVLAGARLLDVEEKLGWQFSANLGGIAPPPRTGNSELKDNVWDGIIGVKGRFAFGADSEWYVPYYLDVGTGDSDLTWQGVAGIGYAFRWGELFAVWRYLDYNLKSGSKIEDVNFNGPAIGVAFRW